MHVIICGGRDLVWSPAHSHYLDALHRRYTFLEVIVGSFRRDPDGYLRGADAHAKAWAEHHGLNTTVMDANWVGHGKSAGPRRNGRMLTYLMAISDSESILLGVAPHEARLVIGFPGG